MVTLILLPTLSCIIPTVTNNKEINIHDTIIANELTTITTVIYNQIIGTITPLLVRTWERRGAYRVLLGKSEGKRPFGRTRHRWEDNIRMHLQEVGLGYGLD